MASTRAVLANARQIVQLKGRRARRISGNLAELIEAPPAPPTRRALVLVLAVGAFTTALNTTLMSPLLKPIGAEFGVSDWAAGQLGTVAGASAALAALAVAPWLDRSSRRRWLRLECLLLAAGTLLS